MQTAMGYRNWLSWFVSMLAEGLLLEGRVDEAEKEAQRAMAMAQQCGERRVEARLNRLLGSIAACRAPDAGDIAEAHYARGLAMATEISARPLIAECHLELGALYRRLGERERGQEHVMSAVVMFRDMGMTYWLEKAEAEIRELG
jgi:tetratricopeptide (TPR) repeat protein